MKPHSDLTVPVVESLAAFRAGLQAIRIVPGLLRLAVCLLLLAFITSMALWVALSLATWKWFFFPGMAWLRLQLPEWLQTAGDALFWVFALLSSAILLLLSYRLTFLFLEWGYDFLVERVIHHFRPAADAPFRLGKWLKELGYSMLLAARDLFFSLLLAPMGWIPLLGIPIVFLGGSILLGRAITEPYRAALASRDQPFQLPSGRLWSYFTIGYFPMALAFIPFVGGLLLPWFHMLVTLGFAFARELHLAHEKLPNLPLPDETYANQT